MPFLVPQTGTSPHKSETFPRGSAREAQKPGTGGCSDGNQRREGRRRREDDVTTEEDLIDMDGDSDADEDGEGNEGERKQMPRERILRQ